MYDDRYIQCIFFSSCKCCSFFEIFKKSEKKKTAPPSNEKEGELVAGASEVAPW